MRKNWVYLVLSFSLSSLAADSFNTMIKDGKGAMSGVLDASTIPMRLFVNKGLKNQEVIYVKGIKSENAHLFDRLAVTVFGKVGKHQGGQYIIDAESVRRATKEELEKLR